MLEKELYEPIKSLWERQGYLVKGEICDCDLVANCQEEWVACELKTALNLEVILQATARQRSYDYVYVCVPQKKQNRTRRKQQQLYALLRRLCLGLICVHFGPEGACARVAIEAKNAGLSPHKTKQKRAHKEFLQRISENEGGVTGVKIVTCYRENAVFLAALLREHGGSMKTSDMRKLGAKKDAATVMRRNVYGWFSHVDRGVYALTPKGESELKDYEDLVEILLKK